MLRVPVDVERVFRFKPSNFLLAYFSLRRQCFCYLISRLCILSFQVWSSFTITAFWSVIVNAQKTDSLKTEELKEKESDKITVLMYVRVIRDAAGNVRMDENIVPNFKLNKWLRLELGVRQGERPQQFGSYNHYKVELQTKMILKTVRLLARLSDNIVRISFTGICKEQLFVHSRRKA